MTGENVTNITQAVRIDNLVFNEMGVIAQLAAEAGSNTKPLIESDPTAIHGEHHDLIVNGLRAIASGRYGKDYHGIRPSQANGLLSFYSEERVTASKT